MKKIILDKRNPLWFNRTMDTITLREYLFRYRISVNRAAAALGVTRQHFSNVMNGSPAGRKMALRVEEWTNGEVKADYLIRDRHDESGRERLCAAGR